MKALRDLMHRLVVVLMVVLLSSGPCAAIPTGDCDGDGKVSVVDALLALRTAVGLDRQEDAVLARCDIGPVDAASVPHPDRQVTMEDALHVLYRSFSVPSWQIPTSVAVPNVVNQTQAAAESILASSLLSVGAVTAEHSDTIAHGVVVGQIPAPSVFTEPAASVSLILSSGPTPPLTIPDVVGLTQQAAVDTLAAKAYRIADVSSASSAMVSLGAVIGQIPQAGTPAATGSSVSIVVSTGPPAASIVVPDVTRLTQVDAIAAITEASLTVGKISEDSSTTTAIGSVVSQHPAANAKAVPGSAVSLVVSSGAGGLASIPPDPTAMASSLDPAASTSFAAATEFLYKENGIQSGVAAGTIEPRRAAVLRGKVLDKDNLPIPGVNVTVMNHPEFGQTYTRADGGFDLAVNGGGYLTVNYRKDGYLSSQRQVNAPWQDYVWLPDVVLIQLDPRVTAVDLASALPVQAVQGSLVSDVDGTRQATVLISQGTSAEMTLPDGSAIPVSKLNLRATEYTVGQNGDKAMPGQLPPTSAFTYAVEFSADEAIGAGATKVTFTSRYTPTSTTSLDFL